MWTYDGLIGMYSTGTFIGGQLHFVTVHPNTHCTTVDAALDSSTQLLAGEHCDGTLDLTRSNTCIKGTCSPFSLTYDVTCA